MSDTDPVLVRRHAAHVELVLNRPDKLNAFDAAQHAALISAFGEAEADASCRAVLLTGAGRAFCAGQDLAERVFVDGVAPDLSSNLTAYYNPLVSRIRASRLPVVAAVNGVAAGAGASIALACDIVVAGRSARFVQSFSKIGLIPDAGGTWTLPRLAGDARARAMAMLAESVSAEQAADWGMIWKAVDDADLAAEAADICQRLSRAPGEAITLIKQAMQVSQTNGFDAQLAVEARLQRHAGEHPDYRSAVEAFRRKA